MRCPTGLIVFCLASGATAAAAPGPDEPSLKTVLSRAAAYTTDYHQRFTVLVAEEHYVQRVGPQRTANDPPQPGAEQERTLRSDYIILPDFAGTNSWLGVREVLEVDGEEVTTDRARLGATGGHVAVAHVAGAGAVRFAGQIQHRGPVPHD